MALRNKYQMEVVHRHLGKGLLVSLPDDGAMSLIRKPDL
jgi:hypothetical protein